MIYNVIYRYLSTVLSYFQIPEQQSDMWSEFLPVQTAGGVLCSAGSNTPRHYRQTYKGKLGLHIQEI